MALRLSSYRYEGEVVLRCEEAGAAEPAILLTDEDPQVGCAAPSRKGISTPNEPPTLVEVLEHLGVERIGSGGDQRVQGGLRITVEQIEPVAVTSDEAKEGESEA